MLVLGGLACTVKADACDELHASVGLDDEAVLAVVAAAPTPTLTWHDPPILDDAWGVPGITIDQAGTCTTALHVDVELREDEAAWSEPEDARECGSPVLLVPVHFALASDDGLLAIEADGGIVSLDDNELSFTILLDTAPASLGLQIGPADSQRELELAIEARLVDGRLRGVVRAISHDCGTGGECSYWAAHILASFD